MADALNLSLLADRIADDLLPVIPALADARLADLIHDACMGWAEGEFLDPAHLNLLCEFVRRRLMQ